MESNEIRERADKYFGPENFQKRVLLILADIIDRLERLEHP